MPAEEIKNVLGDLILGWQSSLFMMLHEIRIFPQRQKSLENNENCLHFPM
jgi:hypothetical protein